jgi:hypothetical protein
MYSNRQAFFQSGGDIRPDHPGRIDRAVDDLLIHQTELQGCLLQGEIELTAPAT